MFKKKKTLSKLYKILLYGIVNFLVVLGLISVTGFKSGGSILGQIIPILIIVFVTGFVNLIVVNKKF